MNNKFRKSLFGFKKKDVTEYLNKYSVETQKCLDEKDDKIEDLQKENEALKAKLSDYEEKIHHLADKMISIDLDDGVKNNYAIFERNFDKWQTIRM